MSPIGDVALATYFLSHFMVPTYMQLHQVVYNALSCFEVLLFYDFEKHKPSRLKCLKKASILGCQDVNSEFFCKNERLVVK